MSTNSITATITSNVDARGLAIIITNDYRNCTSLRPLPGTLSDGTSMKDTFDYLGFVVHWEKNVNNLQITKLIHEACSFQDYHKFKKYECIVFVFSGHGDLGDIVYLQDGSKVSIGEDIIKPFLPKASPIMGKLQKLFFFDACRGKQESRSVMVPRSGPTSGGHDNSSTFEQRGGSLIERIRVPEEGGFLVAYSTMSNHTAWESTKGGAWLQKLAEEIRTNTTSSIEDVLTKVNSDFIEYPTTNVQQPEKLSRLNKVVFLHPQVASKVKIAAVFPSPPTPSLDRTNDTLPPHTPSHAQIQSAASYVPEWTVDNDAVRQLRHCYPSATINNFKDYPHVPAECKGVTYYRSTATVIVPDQNSVVGDSHKYLVNIQLSREMAIMDALSKLQSLQEECGNEMFPCANSPRNSSTLAEQQVKRFFKENHINPQYSYQSDSMTGSTRHRCIVRYTINEQRKKVDSGHYYPEKQDSKEQVFKLILSRENISQDTSNLT